MSPRFDPMLAKVIAHGPDRAEALDRLQAALDETVVLGLTTNLRFLRWLVREPAVRKGEIRIDSARAHLAARRLGAIARHSPTRRGRQRPRRWRPEAGSAAGASTARRACDWRRRTSSGRSRSMPRDSAFGRTASLVTVPEVVVADGIAHLDVAGRSIPFRLAPAPDVDRAARAAASHAGGGPLEILAPMPGAILAVHASVGQQVDAAEPDRDARGDEDGARGPDAHRGPDRGAPGETWRPGGAWRRPRDRRAVAVRSRRWTRSRGGREQGQGGRRRSVLGEDAGAAAPRDPRAAPRAPRSRPPQARRRSARQPRARRGGLRDRAHRDPDRPDRTGHGSPAGLTPA